jgi:predicted dehydrogenase
MKQGFGQSSVSTRGTDRLAIAIVGCGNIAAFYLNTLPRHPMLELSGVMDRNTSRSTAYATYYSVPEYGSLDAMLNDRAVKLVINLTNPRSHFAISKACLEAGKHVHSEKPSSRQIKFRRSLAGAPAGLPTAVYPPRWISDVSL